MIRQRDWPTRVLRRAAPRATPAVLSRRLEVLVVDDEADSREIFVGIAGSRQAEVTTAATVEAAVALPSPSNEAAQRCDDGNELGWFDRLR